MFACLFFGDSLALGTGQAVNASLPQHCEIRAVQGAASTAMLRWPLSGKNYDTAILSVGTNDDVSMAGDAASGRAAAAQRARWRRAYASIARLRSALPSQRVIWLLPYDRSRADVIRWIASGFHDEVLDMASFASRDKIHPSSYRAVAKALLR